MTLVYNIVMPFVEIVKIPIYFALSWWLKRKAIIEKDLYTFAMGNEFNLAENYARVFNIIFTTLTFCSGLPVIFLVSTVSLFVQYWVDKYIILRWSRKAPVIGPAIHNASLKILLIPILIHICFAIWAYGSDDIFHCVKTITFSFASLCYRIGIQIITWLI